MASYVGQMINALSSILKIYRANRTYLRRERC